MKKAFITAILVFSAAFLLLFSFHKDKNKTKLSGKKIQTSFINSPLEVPSEIQSEATFSAEPANVEKIELKNEDEKITLFFETLPRMNNLKPTLDDVHGTPQAILDAGEMLGNMHEYFYSQPQTRSVEMSFYLKCSQQKDFFESIRAICAARLSQHYFEATGHLISAEVFDKNIDNLRRKINL